MSRILSAKNPELDPVGSSSALNRRHESWSHDTPSGMLLAAGNACGGPVVRGPSFGRKLRERNVTHASHPLPHGVRCPQKTSFSPEHFSQGVRASPERAEERNARRRPPWKGRRQTHQLHPVLHSLVLLAIGPGPLCTWWRAAGCAWGCRRGLGRCLAHRCFGEISQAWVIRVQPHCSGSGSKADLRGGLEWPGGWTVWGM